MRVMTPTRARQQRPLDDTGPEPRRRRRTGRGDHGSTSSLELMALTPMLALGVLFILWAGRSARAELVTSLAAQEAAVAAALCCNDRRTDSAADSEPADGPDSAARREHMAQAVIGARPGLDYLCLDEPGPAPGRTGLVTEAAAEVTAAQSATGVARRVLIVTTHVTCLTDGATAPVAGLFGTRTLHGHGAHVAVLAHPHTNAPDDPGDSGDSGDSGDEQPGDEQPGDDAALPDDLVETPNSKSEAQ